MYIVKHCRGGGGGALHLLGGPPRLLKIFYFSDFLPFWGTIGLKSIDFSVLYFYLLFCYKMNIVFIVLFGRERSGAYFTSGLLIWD